MFGNETNWAKQCAADDPGLPPCLLNELGNRPETDEALELPCARCHRSLGDMESEFDSLRGSLKPDPDAKESDHACCQLIERLVVGDVIPMVPENIAGSAVPKTLGPYVLHDVLGEGGMGRVYRATHGRLKKSVAIKVLSEKALASPSAVARFEREMEAVGAVEHTNVVGALDAGTDHGRTYLVMELVQGPDGSQICDAVPEMPVASACEIVRQTAVGLQHAHERGLVHRDVKPSNVMLTTDSSGKPIVKVMDLGLAVVGSDGAEHPLTDDGQLMGTLGFMAPEQATETVQVDARADIYSLGSTLFRLLTGSIPFSGDTYRTPVQRLHGLLHDTAPSVATKRRHLPEGVILLVDQMLNADPELRPASMSEIATRLEKFCDGHNLTALLKQTTSGTTRDPHRSTVDVLATTDAEPTAAAVTQPHPRTPTAKVPRRAGFAPWAIATVLCVLFAAAGTIIWLKQTDGAYLRIDADPSVDISIQLLEDGREVDAFRVGKDQREFWVESGRYEVRLPAEVRDSLTIEGSSVAITRGEDAVVQIRTVTGSAHAKELATKSPAPVAAPTESPTLAHAPPVKEMLIGPPLHPMARRAHMVGPNPQLEDGPGGEGSGSNGWVGSDTDDVTGPSQLRTMLVGVGDQNVELFAGWKGATGEESSLEFIRTTKTFAPQTEADAFSLTFNIEKYLQSQSWGQITIGFANENNNLFGVALLGFADRIFRYGVSDWSSFPDTAVGVTHRYAVQSDRRDATGNESLELSYNGKGKVRLRAFRGPNRTGGVDYDSGFVALNGAEESLLGTFSADRVFIGNDQAGGDRVRRIWLSIDDIKVQSPNDDLMTITFDGANGVVAGEIFAQEDFNSGIRPAGLVGVIGTPRFQNGAVVFPGEGKDDSQRNALRTLIPDYSSRNFVAEVTVTIPPTATGSAGIAFFGLGTGDRNGDYEPIAAPSVAMRVGPTGFQDGFVTIADNGRISSQVDRALGGDGTHRLRLTWNAATRFATFAIHQNYEGGAFKATRGFEPTNASANGFTTENARIFFGGAGGVIFDDFSINPLAADTDTNPTPPSTDAAEEANAAEPDR